MTYRSGAVARMLRMPVATLRVWERRYALTPGSMSPSGRRLYTAEDVQRLALLRQLSERGHAVGSLAGLDLPGLRAVAITHAQALVTAQERTGQGLPAAAARRPGAAPTTDATPGSVTTSDPPSIRLAVVGESLARRLQRPALQRHLAPIVQLVGPFADVDALRAARRRGVAFDAVLLHRPELRLDDVPDVALGASADPVQRGGAAGDEPVACTTAGGPATDCAVLFGIGSDAACRALADQGVALLREPQPDAALGLWLRHWLMSAVPRHARGGPGAPARGRELATGPTLPQRRWDDAALIDFAGLSSTVACECPQHVAELLLQLSRFEAYSAQCAQRSSDDAELHAYLGQVAATARLHFEQALEQVALREGLLLPTARD